MKDDTTTDASTRLLHHDTQSIFSRWYNSHELGAEGSPVAFEYDFEPSGPSCIRTHKTCNFWSHCRGRNGTVRLTVIYVKKLAHRRLVLGSWAESDLISTNTLKLRVLQVGDAHDNERYVCSWQLIIRTPFIQIGNLQSRSQNGGRRDRFLQLIRTLAFKNLLWAAFERTGYLWWSADTKKAQDEIDHIMGCNQLPSFADKSPLPHVWFRSLFGGILSLRHRRWRIYWLLNTQGQYNLAKRVLLTTLLRPYFTTNRSIRIPSHSILIVLKIKSRTSLKA